MQTLERPQSTTTEGITTQQLKIDLHAGDPRWELAWRIASSGNLGRSRLLEKFLLFVVDRHIRGRADEITEQRIGILVFDRPEGYDSNEDNIVRSYARNLRSRILKYYAGEGAGELLCLKIPRGGYTPVFTPRDFSEGTPFLESARADSSIHEIPEASPDQESTIAPGRSTLAQTLHKFVSEQRNFLTTHRLFRRYDILLAFCIGIAIGLSITVVWSRPHIRRGGSSMEVAASNDLWRQIFAADRDTFVVPSDDGLVIMQRLTERPVPLASYISGTYRSKTNNQDDPSAAEIMKLGARRYTSVVDLDFATQLAQIDAVDPTRLIVRYARDLRMDDLRTGNAVLIGSVESNPWIQIFESQTNFRQRISTDPKIPSGFMNAHPLPGEFNLYGTNEKEHTYGVIAYLPNLTSTGHILIVGGLNTAGTQAATTFLLTPSLMAPLLQHAKGANGEYRPFELLISAGNFSSNASAPQIVSERVNAR
jgi:hypothetical protein